MSRKYCSPSRDVMVPSSWLEKRSSCFWIQKVRVSIRCDNTNVVPLAEHADDELAEKYTLGAEGEEGAEQMETTEGQNGDHEEEIGEGEEDVGEVNYIYIIFCQDSHFLEKNDAFFPVRHLMIHKTPSTNMCLKT